MPVDRFPETLHGRVVMSRFPPVRAFRDVDRRSGNGAGTQNETQSAAISA